MKKIIGINLDEIQIIQLENNFKFENNFFSKIN